MHACIETKTGGKSVKYKTVLLHILGERVLEGRSQTIMHYLRNTQSTVMPGFADMPPTQFWRILKSESYIKTWQWKCGKTNALQPHILHDVTHSFFVSAVVTQAATPCKILLNLA